MGAILRNKSIKTKFAFYITVFLAILIALCVVLIREAEESVLDKSLLYAERNRELFCVSAEQIEARIDAACLMLQYDDACLEIMKCESYQEMSYSLVTSFKNVIEEARVVNGSADIAFYSDRFCYSSVFLRMELEILQNRMPEGHGVIPLGICQAKNPKLKSIYYYIFGYNYYVGKEKTGTVFYAVDLNSSSAMLPIPQEKGSNLILMDAQKSVCMFGEELPDEAGKAELLDFLSDEKRWKEREVIKEGRFVIHRTYLDRLDCTLFSVVDSKTVQGSLNSMYRTSVFLIVILAAAYILELLLSITQLSKEVKVKTQELHQAEVLMKDTTIESLRSQINPHFLYNTLELIRADAIAGKTAEISQITAAMGKMYRYSIKGSPIVSLEEELESVKAYVCIQQSRCNNRISVIYNVSGEAAKVKIPRMILQPLVENAFVHGLEPKAGPGTLYIGACAEKGILTITIRDDGLGMESPQLEKIRGDLEKNRENTEKIGLFNVDARLRLFYGGRYSLAISSELGDGTCILLQIQTAAEK